MDGDEYFGTLGGSLMKDLLADLQVDDNDWSLEQLEKELASLEQQESADLSFQQPVFPSFDAASLVVSHAQERSSTASSTPAGLAPPGMGGVDVGGGADAWSLSLQKFTALSLQEDFLAADSARKHSEKRPPPPPGIEALEGAEEYDIKEKPTIAPPPGLVGTGVGESSAFPTPVPQETPLPEPSLPDPRLFPRTPQNSISVGTGPTQDPAQIKDAMTAALQPMHDVREEENLQQPTAPAPAAPQGPPPSGQNMPPVSMTQPVQHMPVHPGRYISHPPQGMVQVGVPLAFPPPGSSAASPLPPAGVIVGAAVPLAGPGPAWHTPHPIPPSPQPMAPPHSKIFCNPFPAASPIPASALETDYMNARDIAYVVHAILKPVLAEPVSDDDYFIQYLKRRMGGAQANPFSPRKPKDMNSEMMSRETKSKEWASEKSTLGHVAKSNVARPRSLIATPQPPPSDQDNEQQKQRANLWKARVYCDQAYQAYQKVIDIWRAASPGGGVPPQVQMPLAKLMRCMGIVMDNEKKEYVVDVEALKLLSKLAKGRTLISRVLEQALLPPNAVQSLVSVLLDVIIPLPNTTKKTDSSQPVEDLTIDRLFRALTGIILKLNLSGGAFVKCLLVVQRHGKASISSPPRMECVHALLQRGGMVIRQEESDQVKSTWESAESQFMAFLQGV